MFRSFLKRNRLVFKTLPVVAGAAVAKLIFAWLGWESFTLNPLYTGLVTGNVFLLSFLLVGVLSDYKESEKLPGELAATIETMADECLILFKDKKAQPARDCLEHLGAIATGVRVWLHGHGQTMAVLDRIAELNPFFLQFESLTQPNFIVRLKQEQSALRKLVIRIDTIRETSFVRAGYTIAGLTTLLLVVSLLLAEFGDLGNEIFLISAITLVLVYILLLVRDLDNPFEYEGETRAGAAEVSLAPLNYAQERIDRYLSVVGEAAAT